MNIVHQINVASVCERLRELTAEALRRGYAAELTAKALRTHGAFFIVPSGDVLNGLRLRLYGL